MTLLISAEGIAGIDEAGRGPFAGPVAAAAVMLDPCRVPAGLDDSKQLSAARRDELFDAIIASARAVSLAFASVEDIDRLNIRGATLMAMRLAVQGLHSQPQAALIDGRDVPPGLSMPARAVVRGDATHASIAAASIVAKVMRDRHMIEMDKAYPGYGFAVHKGYGTPQHQTALVQLGPCPLHRHSFKPVAQAAGIRKTES